MEVSNRLPGPWRGTASTPLIVSHRAGGNEAPENTIAALRAAQKAGSRVMQMDVLLSEDGIPVVFHDKQLKRATGIDKTINTVPAAELPFLKEHLPALLDEKVVINTRDFGAPGYTIPTLHQLLEEVTDWYACPEARSPQTVYIYLVCAHDRLLQIHTSFLRYGMITRSAFLGLTS